MGAALARTGVEEIRNLIPGIEDEKASRGEWKKGEENGRRE